MVDAACSLIDLLIDYDRLPSITCTATECGMCCQHYLRVQRDGLALRFDSVIVFDCIDYFDCFISVWLVAIDSVRLPWVRFGYLRFGSVSLFPGVVLDKFAQHL